ncbi:hypothetical protein FAM09_24865 [Niastella caeni]|uniref:Uncharacterized protein n=1 Tax=Niastella caeni TaxID=2569763 RepID=A0A4S8HKM2_9BACT|nr:hypothetical protein [Niastella caeni]THU34254.1 hypothetical protein FAM09_24865 [Niastella caeni]
MAEYYFKEFEDYVKSLCIKHKDVLHDDTTRRAFIRFQSGEDVESIPNNAGSVLVVIDNFTGRAIGTVDEARLQQQVSLLFVVNVAVTDGNMYVAVESALQKAMNIMFDFYARMIRDMQNDDCGPLRFLMADQMNFFPVDGPVLENHYGWQMDLPFNVNAPAYNADKWNV